VAISRQHSKHLVTIRFLKADGVGFISCLLSLNSALLSRFVDGGFRFTIYFAWFALICVSHAHIAFLALWVV
jgi:hypothetical protein